MLRRRTESRRVFFPWERKTGALGVLGRARVGLVLAVVGALAFIALVRGREERLASIRATRASIGVASRAVSSWQTLPA